MMETVNKSEDKNPQEQPAAAAALATTTSAEDDDLQGLPLVHAVRSEYFITPLNNQFSLIPEVQKLEHDLKKSTEQVKKNATK